MISYMLVHTHLSTPYLDTNRYLHRSSMLTQGRKHIQSLFFEVVV